MVESMVDKWVVLWVGWRTVPMAVLWAEKWVAPMAGSWADLMAV
jgi:hypothetical protein